MGHTMISKCRKALLGALATLAAGAAAAEIPAETSWICWYNNDMTVRCVLQQAAPDSDAAERSVKIAQPAPGAKPLPAHVREIIRAEEALLDREVSIPLFSEPEEPNLVEQLASFTMCYGKPGCTVTFWKPGSDVAMLD